MAWKMKDVQQQRAEFVIRAQRGEECITALCQEFAITRPTGYVWIHRYHQYGLAGLQDLSRRPVSSPKRTPVELEQRIIALRQQRPDWGARKLQVLLQREGIRLPVITVHRVLLRHGLVGDEGRFPHACQRFERGRPNELWQMDFKGPRGWEKPVGPLSVLDDHSRYLIALDGTWCTCGEAVQERLTTAFQRCGLPEEMLMDHGTPWWDEQAPNGWTRLLVWVMKQGIRCVFSGYRHPQTQGKVERFHGSLERARRQRGLRPEELGQEWLDGFRQEYNQVRPHEALEMRTPASVWRASERRYDPQPGRWEYGPDAEVVKLGSQGKLTLDGYRWSISKSLAGEWVELKRIDGRILVYYCNTLIRELDPALQRSTACSLRSHAVDH
jgi:transposase InsO family protein